MNKELKNAGFSLTEVLLAVGTFAIGMIFVAGVFPVAIHFTTVATERTIAAVVTDEAFAKIKIYDVNLALLPPTGCHDFNDVSGIWPVPINPDEFAYPSTDPNIMQKQYYWSALCRRVDPNSQLVQVTVFVSRKVGSGTMYHGGTGGRPVPVPVDVLQFSNDELQIIGDITLINDGYTIVDNKTGRIYRVLERYVPPDDDTILLDLDRVWGPDNPPPNEVWVVPPPISGGRYPCIAIYQRVIRF